jgi:hypothetical protein
MHASVAEFLFGSAEIFSAPDENNSFPQKRNLPLMKKSLDTPLQLKPPED